jgi:hypothetical protein
MGGIRHCNRNAWQIAGLSKRTAWQTMGNWVCSSLLQREGNAFRYIQRAFRSLSLSKVIPEGIRIIPEGIPEAFPVSLSLYSVLVEGVVMVARA